MNKIERMIYIALILALMLAPSGQAAKTATEIEALKVSIDALTESLGKLKVADLENDVRDIKNNVSDIQSDIRGIGVGSPIQVKTSR